MRQEDRVSPQACEPRAPGARTHAADGTDLTLIRWMLSMDHAQRFEVLQSGARSLALLIDARAQR